MRSMIEVYLRVVSGQVARSTFFVADVLHRLGGLNGKSGVDTSAILFIEAALNLCYLRKIQLMATLAVETADTWAKWGDLPADGILLMDDAGRPTKKQVNHSQPSPKLSEVRRGAVAKKRVGEEDFGFVDKAEVLNRAVSWLVGFNWDRDAFFELC
ncbi:hypothetical protein E4U59_007649 [Claviceps monticola]|nr:hypothetical protein E4U59_007649 [Claviceps monticola]